MSLNSYFRQPNYLEIFGVEPPQVFGNTEPFTIMITGSQGMIGNALAVYIAEVQRNNSNSTIQLILASRSWNDPTKQEWISNVHCKLILNSEIEKISEKIDLVIHTASPSNVTKIENIHDLEYTNFHLLQKIIKLEPKKILFISSGEVYQGGLSTEEPLPASLEPNNARSFYPYVKLKTENELIKIANKTSIKVEIVRLFHSFGPGVKADDGRSFGDIIWGAINQREIRLKSPGYQIRTYLYLADAVKALIKIGISKNEKCSITNVGSIHPISILDFAKEVSRISLAPLVFELDSNFSHSPFDLIIPNIKKINLLGWNQETNLETSINLTLKWMKNIRNR
jgi:UDP-glucuronate decarboxylase